MKSSNLLSSLDSAIGPVPVFFVGIGDAGSPSTFPPSTLGVVTTLGISFLLPLLDVLFVSI
ncbi:MAG: hypothetical protein LBC34_01620 [Rickettsiales bacterium]|nr:hypothetical protein [Rickettsiales bacterium]